MQEKQLLRDADIEPTNDVISDALGAASDAYKKFIDRLQNHDIEVEWRYYNDGKAWLGKGLYKWTTTRGTKKEMTAFWLSIWDGFFKVTLYISEKYRADALALSLGDEVKKMVEDAKQIGKLKFFPLIFELRSDEQFDEIFTLVDFRKVLN